MSTYVLAGSDQKGQTVYYTGRAGSGWVNSDPAEAFSYSDNHLAVETAERFNRYSGVHGVAFRVEPNAVVFTAAHKRRAMNLIGEAIELEEADALRRQYRSMSE